MGVTLRSTNGGADGYKTTALTYAELNQNFLDFMTLTGTGATRTLSSINAPDFNSTSDSRLKENIHQIENTDSIYKINGYTFNFKADVTGKKKYGLIADELQVEFPELVSVGEDGYLRVSYDSVVPILLEALKQQKKDIELLKKEVSDLRQRVNNVS